VVHPHLKTNIILLRFAGIIVAFSRSNTGLYRFNEKMMSSLNTDDLARVLNKVLKLICALADNDAIRNEFIDSGTCDIIINAVQTHLKKDSILIRFAEFIVLFSQSNSGVEQITKKMKETLNKEDLEAVTERIAIIAEYGYIPEEYKDLIDDNEEDFECQI